MADPRIERTINTYDSPLTPTEITLNTLTYTEILDANPLRIGYKVSNPSANTILIREKTDVDDLDRGFVLFGRMIYESKPDNVPTGKIFAKAVNGAPSILVTDE